MNINQAIKARSSTRAFLDKPITTDVIESILDAARFAPSGKNTQPWYVSVLQGKTKQTICDDYLQAYQNAETPRPDYQYYANDLPAQQRQRAFDCGMALYGALGIDRQDKAKRKEIWQWNYSFFHAPVGLLLWLDNNASDGSWFDLGSFCQNIMLAALEYGLATCPQASMAEFPDLARKSLEPDYDDKILACGIALGYADEAASVNNYRTERMGVAEFSRFYN